jgi:hypothetical protein
MSILPTTLPSRTVDPYPFSKINLGKKIGEGMAKAVALDATNHEFKQAKVKEAANKRAEALNGFKKIQEIGNQAGESSLVRDRPANFSGVTATYHTGGATSNKPRSSVLATSAGAAGAGRAPRRAQSVPAAGPSLSAAQSRPR